ncbi:exported hypothetical protein [Actinacidiphila cocklensis]|uniref:Uncharacterized protein n=1 Tax=Actinacidiphila cocklensis TaxID=887465 RepID=A0A9W4GRB8_9ACTN|nr:exported hypothetical protein [Actinacidiphila cocklensis]
MNCPFRAPREGRRAGNVVLGSAGAIPPCASAELPPPAAMRTSRGTFTPCADRVTHRPRAPAPHTTALRAVP